MPYLRDYSPIIVPKFTPGNSMRSREIILGSVATTLRAATKVGTPYTCRHIQDFTSRVRAAVTCKPRVYLVEKNSLAPLMIDDTSYDTS